MPEQKGGNAEYLPAWRLGALADPDGALSCSMAPGYRGLRQGLPVPKGNYEQG